MCGETERIHLHHKTYERIGEELLTDLVPLCPNCHTLVHVLERRGEMGLDFEGFDSPERAAAYAAQRREISDDERREREFEEQKRWVRSVSAGLRRSIAEGRKAGVDLSTEIAAVDEAVKALANASSPQ